MAIISSIIGLASGFAQFLSPEIHGSFRLITISAILVALTVGGVRLLERVRKISLSTALVIAVLAAVVGGGIGYRIRGSGPSRPVRPDTAASTEPNIDHPVEELTNSSSTTPRTSGTIDDHHDDAATDTPDATSAAEQKLSGQFQAPPADSTGCLAGLRFTISQSLPSDKDIWVMVYGNADKSSIYPERKLTFTGGKASAAPFPIGSDKDAEGSRFEVLSVLVDDATTKRYESQANPPVDSALPGQVLDHFTVTRKGKYLPCS